MAYGLGIVDVGIYGGQLIDSIAKDDISPISHLPPVGFI